MVFGHQRGATEMEEVAREILMEESSMDHSFTTPEERDYSYSQYATSSPDDPAHMATATAVGTTMSASKYASSRPSPQAPNNHPISTIDGPGQSHKYAPAANAAAKSDPQSQSRSRSDLGKVRRHNSTNSYCDSRDDSDSRQTSGASRRLQRSRDWMEKARSARSLPRDSRRTQSTNHGSHVGSIRSNVSGSAASRRIRDASQDQSLTTEESPHLEELDSIISNNERRWSPTFDSQAKRSKSVPRSHSRSPEVEAPKQKNVAHSRFNDQMRFYASSPVLTNLSGSSPVPSSKGSSLPSKSPGSEYRSSTDLGDAPSMPSDDSRREEATPLSVVRNDTNLSTSSKSTSLRDGAYAHDTMPTSKWRGKSSKALEDAMRITQKVSQWNDERLQSNAPRGETSAASKAIVGDAPDAPTMDAGASQTSKSTGSSKKSTRRSKVLSLRLDTSLANEESQDDIVDNHDHGERGIDSTNNNNNNGNGSGNDENKPQSQRKNATTPTRPTNRLRSPRINARFSRFGATSSTAAPSPKSTTLTALTRSPRFRRRFSPRCSAGSPRRRLASPRSSNKGNNEVYDASKARPATHAAASSSFARADSNAATDLSTNKNDTPSPPTDNNDDADDDAGRLISEPTMNTSKPAMAFATTNSYKARRRMFEKTTKTSASSDGVSDSAQEVEEEKPMVLQTKTNRHGSKTNAQPHEDIHSSDSKESHSIKVIEKADGHSLSSVSSIEDSVNNMTAQDTGTRNFVAAVSSRRFWEQAAQRAVQHPTMNTTTTNKTTTTTTSRPVPPSNDKEEVVDATARAPTKPVLSSNRSQPTLGTNAEGEQAVDSEIEETTIEDQVPDTNAKSNVASWAAVRDRLKPTPAHAKNRRSQPDLAVDVDVNANVGANVGANAGVSVDDDKHKQGAQHSNATKTKAADGREPETQTNSDECAPKQAVLSSTAATPTKTASGSKWSMFESSTPRSYIASTLKATPAWLKKRLAMTNQAEIAVAPEASEAASAASPSPAEPATTTANRVSTLTVAASQPEGKSAYFRKATNSKSTRATFSTPIRTRADSMDNAEGPENDAQATSKDASRELRESPVVYPADMKRFSFDTRRGTTPKVGLPSYLRKDPALQTQSSMRDNNNNNNDGHSDGNNINGNNNKNDPVLATATVAHPKTTRTESHPTRHTSTAPHSWNKDNREEQPNEEDAATPVTKSTAADKPPATAKDPNVSNIANRWSVFGSTVTSQHNTATSQNTTAGTAARSWKPKRSEVAEQNRQESEDGEVRLVIGPSVADGVAQLPSKIRSDSHATSDASAEQEKGPDENTSTEAAAASASPAAPPRIPKSPLRAARSFFESKSNASSNTRTRPVASAPSWAKKKAKSLGAFTQQHDSMEGSSNGTNGNSGANMADHQEQQKQSSDHIVEGFDNAIIGENGRRKLPPKSPRSPGTSAIKRRTFSFSSNRNFQNTAVRQPSPHGIMQTETTADDAESKPLTACAIPSSERPTQSAFGRGRQQVSSRIITGRSNVETAETIGVNVPEDGAVAPSENQRTGREGRAMSNRNGETGRRPNRSPSPFHRFRSMFESGTSRPTPPCSPQTSSKPSDTGPPPPSTSSIPAPAPAANVVPVNANAAAPVALSNGKSSVAGYFGRRPSLSRRQQAPNDALLQLPEAMATSADNVDTAHTGPKCEPGKTQNLSAVAHSAKQDGNVHGEQAAHHNQAVVNQHADGVADTSPWSIKSCGLQLSVSGISTKFGGVRSVTRGTSPMTGTTTNAWSKQRATIVGSAPHITIAESHQHQQQQRKPGLQPAADSQQDAAAVHTSRMLYGKNRMTATVATGTSAAEPASANEATSNSGEQAAHQNEEQTQQVGGTPTGLKARMSMFERLSSPGSTKRSFTPTPKKRDNHQSAGQTTDTPADAESKTKTKTKKTVVDHPATHGDRDHDDNITGTTSCSGSKSASNYARLLTQKRRHQPPARPATQEKTAPLPTTTTAAPAPNKSTIADMRTTDRISETRQQAEPGTGQWNHRSSNSFGANRAMFQAQGSTPSKLTVSNLSGGGTGGVGGGLPRSCTGDSSWTPRSTTSAKSAPAAAPAIRATVAALTSQVDASTTQQPVAKPQLVKSKSFKASISMFQSFDHAKAAASPLSQTKQNGHTTNDSVTKKDAQRGGSAHAIKKASPATGKADEPLAANAQTQAVEDKAGAHRIKRTSSFKASLAMFADKESSVAIMGPPSTPQQFNQAKSRAHSNQKSTVAPVPFAATHKDTMDEAKVQPSSSFQSSASKNSCDFEELEIDRQAAQIASSLEHGKQQRARQNNWPPQRLDHQHRHHCQQQQQHARGDAVGTSAATQGSAPGGHVDDVVQTAPPSEELQGQLRFGNFAEDNGGASFFELEIDRQARQRQKEAHGRRKGDAVANTVPGPVPATRNKPAACNQQQGFEPNATTATVPRSANVSVEGKPGVTRHTAWNRNGAIAARSQAPKLGVVVAHMQAKTKAAHQDVRDDHEDGASKQRQRQQQQQQQLKSETMRQNENQPRVAILPPAASSPPRANQTRHSSWKRHLDDQRPGASKPLDFTIKSAKADQHEKQPETVGHSMNVADGRRSVGVAPRRDSLRSTKYTSRPSPRASPRTSSAGKTKNKVRAMPTRSGGVAGWQRTSLPHPGQALYNGNIWGGSTGFPEPPRNMLDGATGRASPLIMNLRGEDGVTPPFSEIWYDEDDRDACSSLGGDNNEQYRLPVVFDVHHPPPIFEESQQHVEDHGAGDHDRHQQVQVQAPKSPPPVRRLAPSIRDISPRYNHDEPQMSPMEQQPGLWSC